MSPVLPPHANLEHLKKQAKDLLQELQRRSPGSKLADAQHAIARAYGFASWPKLKAHVESLTRAAGNEHPFAGTWTANVSKSTRHPLNQFQSATLQFAVLGDSVTIVDHVVSASGQEEHGTHTIQADGIEHPSGRPGYAVEARWRGPRILEAVGKNGGEVDGRVTYEVSADGQTLIVSATHASGEQAVVFERNVT